MNKVNVLIFPCGAENALNIHNSLKYNIHFELFGATSKYDHSQYIYDDQHLSIDNYNIHDKSFFIKFNKLIDAFNIDYIIPTHDEIILFLIENQDKINAKIIASPVETCKVAYSKIDTFNKLQGSFYLPKVYSDITNIKYPAFIKPNHGAGGKGARIINSEIELPSCKEIKAYLICEYLPGEEITVDCFTNKNGKLLFIGPRTRERITTGVSFRSKNIENTDYINSVAEDLNKKFKFRGLWFFQLKCDSDGIYKLMEISVRCAGTMDLYRQLGINFLSLSLFDFMGYDVEILKNNYNIELDRYYKSCYKLDFDYEYVYIDFDDTIILNNKVNTTVISFIYQCLNSNKKIILLTKHSTDIYLDLKKYKLDQNVFYQIIKLGLDEKKSDYIVYDKSIFIDNYFFDRKDVYLAKGIPVFDIDAVESLLDAN